MTLKELQGTLEFVGRGLGPKDDWMPVLFLDREGHGAVIGTPLMEDEAQKDLCAAVLYAMIKKTNPDRAFFVTTAWVGEELDNRFMSDEDFHEAMRQGWIPSPSQDPDRKEIVSVVMYDKNGESAMMFGYIERSETQPPKIVRWRIEQSKGIEVQGRFGNAMRKGFADAEEKGNLDVLSKLPGLMRSEPEN